MILTGIITLESFEYNAETNSFYSGFKRSNPLNTQHLLGCVLLIAHMQCGYKKADIPFGFPSKCPPYKLK